MFIPNDVILNSYLQALSAAMVLTQIDHQELTYVSIYLLVPRHLWVILEPCLSFIPITANSPPTPLTSTFQTSLIHSDFPRHHEFTTNSTHLYLSEISNSLRFPTSSWFTSLDHHLSQRLVQWKFDFSVHLFFPLQIHSLTVARMTSTKGKSGYVTHYTQSSLIASWHF